MCVCLRVCVHVRACVCLHVCAPYNCLYPQINITLYIFLITPNICRMRCPIDVIHTVKNGASTQTCVSNMCEVIRNNFGLKINSINPIDIVNIKWINYIYPLIPQIFLYT